jgi:hypothetical protein
MIYTMIVIIISLVPANAQRHESYEGFVSGLRANAVKGEAFYQREDAKFPLEAGHKLQEGDFIKTEPNSYAELLLQPGNYLRIGGDSELQIFSDPQDKMRLKLNRGSISVEILSKEGEASRYYEAFSQIFHLIRVITPNAEVFITRSGIFRINASGARTELIARDGEAVINGRRVKEKRNGVATSRGVEIVDIDSKFQDNFDAWGRERAKELIHANRVLKHESPWAKNRKEGDETVVDVPKEESESKSHRLVVSAKPGGINFVEAGVELSRSMKDWVPLTDKSQLEAGDKVRTGAHTFAELSLLPDINLRLDSKSEVVFEKLSNEAITVKLLQGSAILDVARFDSKEVPPISFGGPSTTVTVADEGNYRIDINPNGDEITVRDGKVILKARSVGGCRKISAAAVADCDKKRNDNFDFWSEHRGEGTLYNGRDVVSMVAHLDRIRQLRFRNTGFWFQNPGKTNYTFVPFSSISFRSPYGGSYSTVLSPRRVPMIRPDFRPNPPFGGVRGPQIASPRP